MWMTSSTGIPSPLKKTKNNSFALKRKAVGGAVTIINPHHEYSQDADYTSELVVTPIPRAIYNCYLVNSDYSIVNVGLQGYKFSENFENISITPNRAWYNDSNIVLITEKLVSSFQNELDVTVGYNLLAPVVSSNNTNQYLLDFTPNFTPIKAIIEDITYSVSNNKFSTNINYPIGKLIQVQGKLTVNIALPQLRIIEIDLSSISAEQINRIDYFGYSFTKLENPYMLRHGEFYFNDSTRILSLFTPLHTTYGLKVKQVENTSSEATQFVSNL